MNEAGRAGPQSGPRGSTSTPHGDSHGDRHSDRRRRDWDELAALDPFWAILSAPATRYGRWRREDFFETGRGEIAAVLERAEGLGRPRHRNRSLDFGCGVGRTTRALSDHFASSDGVDVSSAMVARARELNADCSSCSFHVLSDRGLEAFSSRTFDLVYSSFVLQHLPSPADAARCISELLRVTRADGLAVFQMTDRLPWHRRLQPRPRLYALLRSAGVPSRRLYSGLRLHPIRMISLARPDVELAVRAAGGSVAIVEPIDARDASAGLRYYAYPAA